MSIATESRQILQRVINMPKLVASVEQHLLDEQNDAVAPIAATCDSDGHSHDISDPTHRAAVSRTYSGYARSLSELGQAMRNITKALDDAERTCTAIIGRDHTPAPDDEQRCPGWNDELRARLGGCGKVLERWVDGQGNSHVRSTYLCAGCRKAADRAERAEEAA